MARLVDLKPKWVGILNWSSDDVFYIGLTFECPHCVEHGIGYSQRLGVMFDPPIDLSKLIANNKIIWGGDTVTQKWTRVSGETFDTLTLSPSVDCSRCGHWHGFIQNGEVK